VRVCDDKAAGNSIHCTGGIIPETVGDGDYGLEACSLRKYKSINYVSTFKKIFNTRSQESVDVCLEMCGCLQAEQTNAIYAKARF